MQITFKQYAWIDPRHETVDSVESGKHHPLLCSSAPGTGGYFEREGHACIGEASVTINLFERDKITADQIAALNTALQSVRAESLQKENAILLQISKLQALTMDVGAP
jgi:hypothetical protein